MSFLRGLIAGLCLAVLQVAAARTGLEYGPFRASRDGAAVVLLVLVPLAIMWGWTWVSDTYAGRSHPRMVGFTAALVFGASLAAPLDRLAFGPLDTESLTATAAALPELLGPALVFLVPAFAIAAVLFWLFASGRLPARFLPLAFAYLAGLPFVVLYPPVAIGAIGGTAAGHAWRAPRSQTGIAMLVVVLAVLATAGTMYLPLVLEANGIALPAQ